MLFTPCYKYWNIINFCVKFGFTAMANAVFPPSPGLASGRYFICGVDVCQEGLQFCNVGDRRCEYCTDHHQDCFTYAQHQNCTQYCQDQWIQNQTSMCTVSEPVDCEDGKLYKILSLIFFILFLTAIFVLLLQEKRVRNVLKSIVLYFIPEEIVSAIENLLKGKVEEPVNTQVHATTETDLEGISITENHSGDNGRGQNNNRRQERNEERTLQKLLKAKAPESHHTDQNMSTETNEPNNYKQRNNNINKGDVTSHEKPGTSGIVAPSSTVENNRESGSSINRSLKEALDSLSSSETYTYNCEFSDRSEKKVTYSQINEETKLLEHHNNTSQSEGSKHEAEENHSDQQCFVTPRPELSTMSSRGGYQEMLQSSNQSTDKGYGTKTVNDMRVPLCS